MYSSRRVESKMPFRCEDDDATRIQATVRGWLTRQRLRYPFVYFPPRPISPDSVRYTAPSYRNDPWIYWDREQFLERDCGLETEDGDCVRRDRDLACAIVRAGLAT